MEWLKQTEINSKNIAKRNEKPPTTSNIKRPIQGPSLLLTVGGTIFSETCIQVEVGL